MPVQTASREVTIPTPDNNLFARLDWQLSPAHPLTSRDNYVKASDENLSRGITGYRLTSNAYVINDRTVGAVTSRSSTPGRSPRPGCAPRPPDTAPLG